MGETQLLLNLKQVAVCYGNKSRSWVYEAAASKRIPQPARLGASLVWSAAEVRADIEQKLSGERFAVKPRRPRATKSTSSEARAA